MTASHTNAVRYAHEHRQGFIDELNEFASIPSVSTDPAHKPDMQRAAEWVASQLKKIGMSKVIIFPTQGHPVVYGESLSAGSKAPTVLIYGHYDVQPAEPLELWESGAFEPAIRGDFIYGRGVTDMKGQIIASLMAVESIVRTGSLPS